MEKIKIKKDTHFLFKKKFDIQKGKSTDPMTITATIPTTDIFP